MIIISSYNFKLMLITLAINGLAQMQHTNDEISIVTCKGNDVDMLWNVDEEESKISQLQLYFSNTIICYTSLVNGFIVSPSYQGRIERIGKTSFRLKNVSLDDEGYYTMLALIPWSTNDKMKQMVLRILEPPTEKCTCNIQPDFKCELPTSDCGRPSVSLVWKRKKTYEDLGGGNWTMNSTLQDEDILSCLDGEAMKCVNDSRQFCTNVSIPHQVTERSHEDRSTQQTDSVPVPGFKGTDNDSTVFNKFRDLLIGSLSVTAIIIIAAVLIVFVTIYYRVKKFRKKSEHIAFHEDASPDTEETVPTNDTETEIKFQTQQHTSLNPSHDTREAVTTKDSNAENDFQKLPKNATHEMKILLNQIREEYMTFPSTDTEEAISMNDLNIDKEFQNLQKVVLHMRSFLSRVPGEFITYPILDTGEATCMKDSHVENECLRFQKSTCQMMHLFNQIHGEYMTYKKNATGKSGPKNQCMSHSVRNIDTEEVLSMNDLNTEREFTNLQNVVLHMRSFVSQVPEEFITCTWPDSAEFIPMNQPMTDLDTEGDLQKLLQPTLGPNLDTGEATCMKDSHVENEFQRLKKATDQMMHLFNQIREEYMTYKMPGKAEIVTDHQNSLSFVEA